MEKNNSIASQFKFTQLFGYKNSDKVQEEDIISTLKYDHSGKYLAIGDHAGRIIIFQCPEVKKKPQSYQYLAEYQSHIRQFDPLRSMDIDQSIKDMCWIRTQGRYLKMATTNTKRIKLWKISEKSQKKVAKSSGRELNIPKIQTIQSSYVSNPYKVFPAQHEGDINSISISGNEEYLISSDQIQLFLWNLEKPQRPFMIADLKLDQKIQEVKETITCSKFHPVSDSLLLFGTNKGTLRIGDLRVSALCDKGLSFTSEPPKKPSFLTDMLASYSAAEFLRDGRHVIVRDFLTVKLWDLNNTKKPVASIVVQDSLQPKLCQMFQNDAILDKFGITGSKDNSTILTGNYNNSFHLIDTKDFTNMQYELNYKKATINKQIIPNKIIPLSKMDYIHKTVATDFNPTKNSIAVSSLNCFFIYSV